MLKKCLFINVFILIGVTRTFAVSDNDSIPPIFTSSPSDTLVLCEENIDSLLSSWYNNNGGAILDDSTAIIQKSIGLQEAIDSLLNMHVNCDNEGLLVVDFFGVDSCGNASLDTLSGTFQIADNIAPDITNGAMSVSVECNEMTQDSLYNWLDNIGGASASDNCNDSIVWLNLIWEDNLGNQGFANIGDTYNIPILRDSCAWHVNVSFFVQDLCGNINNTRATFSILEDTIGPVLIQFPNDTLILCDQILDTIAPVFLDACDNVISSNLIETTTQNSETTLCEHYSYDISRTWIAQDACQNTAEFTQVITVVDTIGPATTLQNIVIKDCDDDLTEVEEFIVTSDNCSQVEISFSDSLTVSNSCQQQRIRTWTITDVCGNSSEVTQTIQTQDFSPPEFVVSPLDTMVSCDNQNIQNIFSVWIDNYAGSQVSDNCNSSLLFARSENNLSDTLSIINGSVPEFEISNCSPDIQDSIVSSQEVFFYSFDICGNISSQNASFEIIDTVAPIIINCPVDLDVILEPNECDSEVTMNLPTFTDACLDVNDAEWIVELDQDFILEPSNNSVNTQLEIGNHQIEYIINDCANNTTSCIQNIFIRDTFPPELQCPLDISLDLPFDACETELTLPRLIDFTDNCFGASDFDATLPNGDAFINFELNEVDSTYRAISFPVEFDGIITEGRLFKPSIIIEYALNISEDSRVIIKSEFGDDLITLSDSNCEVTKEKLLIDENQFLIWSADNDIKFTVLFENGSGEGTLPCMPEGLNGDITIDEFSFLKITLQFSDIVPTFRVEDLDRNIVSSDEEIVTLGQGQYDLIFEAADFGGNIGECRTNISINDVSPPTISCIDQVFEISPDSLGQIDINLNDLSIFIVDNCDIQDASFFPSEISCLDIGKIVPINVQALDSNNNFANCTANLSVVGAQLSPTFISGLCFADSLKLFANNSNNNIVSFNWTGPNNYSSSDQNPILTNISNQNAGVYNLVVVNSEGCTFEGSVNVQINQFTSPQISSSESRYCVGDEILINSNAFTEDVNYFWYEGISPNGILIDETDGPSLEITPSLGQHQYYVQVIGEGCNSNPSTTLEIEILPTPQAVIENPFITICQGDDISLETDVFDVNFSYEWRGPDGYFSDQQFAEVINNAQDINAGQYSLVISNGACSSLPAIAEVIIFEPPSQPMIEGESVFCEGQSSVLTVSNIPNATRYHWYLNGVLFTTVSNNNLLIPSISDDQSGEWTVVVEDAICFSDTSEVFEIFVESSLNIGASNNGPVCDGDTISLTSSFIPNATYQWQDPSGNFIDGREIEALAIDGIYSVTVTTASNCIATTSTEVEVGIRPTITALSNTSLECMNEGESISLVPTVFPQGNYQYQWSGPNNYTSSQVQPSIQNINQDDAGIYELIVIQDNCASAVSTTLVDFTIIPDAAIIDGDNNLCAGEDLNLNILNPTIGNQTQWLWTTPLGPITTATPSLMIQNFSVTQVGEYSVIQELNGCRSAISESIVINLENRPPTPNITGENNICEGSTLLLSATDEANATYLWSTPLGEITTNSNILEIPNVTSDNIGNYQVITQKTNCVSEQSSSYAINVLPSPESPSFQQNEIEICADDSELLIVCVNANSNSFDKLAIIDQNTNTIIQESTSTCFDLSFLVGNVSQSFSLSVAAIKDDCMSENNDIININIFESPDAFLELEDDTLFLCAQEFLSLTPDIIPNGVTGVWSSPDPEINIFNAESLTPSFSNLREGNNQINVTSSFGSCLNYAEDIINIFVVSEIDAEDDIYEGEYNQALTISPLENDNFTSSVFINDVEDPRDGQAIIEGQNISLGPQNNFIGSFQLEYEICYVDCPELCSSAFITINIGDNVDCFAGNIITPNNDGVNDVFTIPCLESGNYIDNSIVIFNEWGDEVFSAKPYLNNWDGTFQNNQLPVGTYFYILELGDIARPIQGFIIIEN